MAHNVTAHSSSERGEFCGCTMRVYLKYVVSTQGGSCIVLPWSDVIAWSGLGAVVETARMTTYGVEYNK